MNGREWMRSSLGAAGVLATAGRARGEEPADDSDPAALIAKIGPRMANVPIQSTGLAAGLHLIQGPC